ncbi:DUF86 domain-containing protein [Roseofilum sp. Belize Diploria]|uniref:HepT-like ribonuclease domain-containing protein n=1 Tax=Roseofilum sp. Belize Diploria TaxID=2821501 RepID=UPI000E9E2408|nr:DUF86 domain-containing protein [Roseofilum sp. Belize Diploria]MBP0009735.1 DUF86 domain-containing protein [Roseofilum sp. Belize Diploria]HBR00669.1 DUF86 domain-containing protein [Cyanobacteria bacterium UBA11691]
MSRDESYLLDIAKFCRTILRLTENMTQADFEGDERTQLAVLYEITIIGEVVKRLSSEFCDRHSAVEWRQIAGMRDRLIHDYDEVKLDLVWQVVQTNIPELLEYIIPLLPERSPGG